MCTYTCRLVSARSRERTVGSIQGSWDDMLCWRKYERRRQRSACVFVGTSCSLHTEGKFSSCDTAMLSCLGKCEGFGKLWRRRFASHSSGLGAWATRKCRERKLIHTGRSSKSASASFSFQLPENPQAKHDSRDKEPTRPLHCTLKPTLELQR